MTCSPSFLRIRPWSTKTQVSWSPIAWCTSSAATDESTPPQRPQMTFAVADLGADARDLLLDDRRRRPRHVAAADVAEEALEDVLAVGRVDDLGVELDAVDAALDRLEGRDRRRGRRGQRGEAGRRREDGVAVRHPARLLARAGRAAARPARGPSAWSGRTRRPRRPRPCRRAFRRERAACRSRCPAPGCRARAAPCRAAARRRRTPTRGRRRGSGPSACAAATSSAPTWWGSSSLKTPHSRTRRAISCEYCPP